MAAMAVCASQAFGQPRFSSQGHKGSVVSIFNDAAAKEKAFYSVGSDGFIIRWQNGIGEHFQASDKKIELAAISPNAKEILFYETDGGVYHSVKAWDTGAKKLKRSFLFKAPVTSVSYSARGTYIMATTSERNGVYFFSAANGKPFVKIRDFGMTATWAKTSESEKNLLLYSSDDGSLCYFSFKTGKAIKKIQTEAGLKNIELFAKNRFLAGIKNNSIAIASAENGAKLKTVLTKTPSIIGGASDSLSLQYIDGSAGLYSVYKIEITESGIKGPLIEKNIKAKEGFFIRSAFLDEGGSQNEGAEEALAKKIFLACEDGNIYSADASGNGLPAPLELISNEVYQKIHGVCSDGQNLYILTNEEIIKANYEGKKLESFKNLRDWTKIDFAFGRLVLRSDDRRLGVYEMDAQSGQAAPLFESQNRIKNIKAAKIKGQEGFLEVENSVVNFYSFKTRERTELYLGSGIQDAAALENDTLAVAKTASSNPPSALVLVNLKTRETVPAKIEGDIVARLEESSGYVFGSRLISAGEGYSTSVFCIGSKALAVKELLSSPKEESDAFVRADFPLAFTKVGSKDISVINVKTLKKHSLKNSPSFAIDIAKCGGRMASLNEDSSITWHNIEQPLPLAQWYIDSKGQIVEF
mgnify:CR=1 FL=1